MLLLKKIITRCTLVTLLISSFGYTVKLHGSEGYSEIRWGVSAWQGARPTMEDRHSVKNLADFRFFGVYDGHAGTNAAKFVKNNLHENFLCAKDKTIKQRLTSAFLKTDEDFLAHSKFKNDFSGTTAVVAVIDAKTGKLSLAHAGDSRAILVRGGKVLFATKDHKPEIPLERQRIEAAGGSLACIEKLCLSLDGCPHSFRVDYLAMSRAIGDRLVKGHGVIASPDVEKIDIQGDDIIVLASDGLWDAVKNEEAAVFVDEKLNKSDQESLVICNPVQNIIEKVVDESGNEQIKFVAQALQNMACERGSKDDISVLIVKFESFSLTTRLLKSISTNKNTILGSGVIIFCLLYCLGS